MEKKEVTAIFDIGKTNKKFFLFDSDYNEVYKEYKSFQEILDEDGFPTENLEALGQWVTEVFYKALLSEEYQITSLNFSTYGASMVHLDEKGKSLTPLYNYLKPVPDSILQEFYGTYGDKAKIETETASPISGNLLNSGLQLFWLKKTRPELFSKIKWSLHFPQYLSYLFSKKPLSEYTSIGCHTALWNYEKETYHEWLVQEGIEKNLPAITSTKTSTTATVQGNQIRVGVGIHDSSSALLPYLLNQKKPFILVSTGTWNVTLNPFSENTSAPSNSENEKLFYMDYDGKPVKATRVLLGPLFNEKVESLEKHFNTSQGYHKNVLFDSILYQQQESNSKQYFALDATAENQKNKVDLTQFSSFEEAYHQLLIELTAIQAENIRAAMDPKTKVKKLFIDGGFADNDVFVQLLAIRFPKLKVRITQSPSGSALGAAIAVSDKELPSKFLKRHYRMRKIKPALPTN